MGQLYNTMHRLVLRPGRDKNYDPLSRHLGSFLGYGSVREAPLIRVKILVFIENPKKRSSNYHLVRKFDPINDFFKRRV